MRTNIVKRFNNLRVSFRFLIIGACILPFLGLAGGTSTWGILQVNDEVQNIASDQLFSVYTLGKTLQDIEKVRGDCSELVLESSPAAIQQEIAGLKTDLANTNQAWQIYTSHPPTNEEKPFWQQYETAWTEWNKNINQLITLEQPKILLALSPVIKQILVGGNSLTAITAKLLDINYDESLGVATSTQNTTNLVMLFITFGGIGWLTVLCTAGFILARSMENMTKNLHKLNSELNEELNHAENKRSFGEEVSRQLKSMTAELAATAYQQANRSREQASVVAEIATNLKELREAASYIASNTTQVAEAFEQTLVAAREVESKSEYLNQLILRGTQAVSILTTAIERIGGHSEQLVLRLQALTENSREIGDIIETMGNIADRTHLLALNAAIESADSRLSMVDGGNRFAVIASEIKKLADRSLASAKEVQQVITGVQNAITLAGLAAEDSKKEVLQTINQARISGEVITDLGQAAAESVQSATRIVAKVDAVSLLAYQIRLATQQQSGSTKEIASIMETIGIATSENASASTQLKGAVSEIDNISAQLGQILGGSKLTEGWT